MGEALEKSWRRAWEEETRELDSRSFLRRVERTVWDMFGDKIGDVARGRVVDGLVGCG